MVAKLSILLVLIVFVVFLPSLSLQLTNWDDDKFVTNNADIRQLDVPHITKMFTSFYEGGYTPLSQLSFAFNYYVHGLNPFGYHLVNVALHALNALLVFHILNFLKLSNKAAFMAAFIWAIHPMRVESVTWVAERKDVLFTFFYLIAIWLYLKNCIKSSWVIFVCACLAKHQAALLGLLLPVRRWRVNLIFLTTGLGMLMVTLLHATSGWTNQATYSAMEKFFFMNFAAMIYAIKSFIPFQLCVLYPYPAITQGVLPWYVYGSVGVVAGLILVTVYTSRLNPLIGVGVYFFAVNILLPLANIVAGGYLLNDRYTYVASIGLFLAITLCAQYYYQRISCQWVKHVLMVCLVIYIVGMGVITIQRQAVWKDGISLWSDVIKQYPQQARFYDNRGTAYILTKQPMLALQDFNTAIRLDPTFPGSYNNRAAILLEQGKDKEALADYHRAIFYDKNYGVAYFNRGIYYYHHGEMELALQDLDQAITHGLHVDQEFYGYVMYRVKLLKEQR